MQFFFPAHQIPTYALIFLPVDDRRRHEVSVETRLEGRNLYLAVREAGADSEVGTKCSEVEPRHWVHAIL